MRAWDVHVRLHFLSCKAELGVRALVSYLLEINENVRQKKNVKEFTENKVTSELPIYMVNRERRMQPWMAPPPRQHTRACTLTLYSSSSSLKTQCIAHPFLSNSADYSYSHCTHLNLKYSDGDKGCI